MTIFTEMLAIIEEYMFPPGGGSGVTPPFVFSKAGNATLGTYLRTGEAIGSVTGQLIKGMNNIVEVNVSNGNAVGSTTRLQLQRRTARTTFTDITGAFVDIPSGNYKGKNTGLSISLGPDDEVCVYVKSGSTLDNPIVTLFVSPQSI